MDLDQLERALRAEAAAVAPADLVAARRGVAACVRRHRVRRGAALAAVVVLALAVSAALVGHHGQSAERVVTNSGPVPHLIPGYMSDQVRFSDVVDLPDDHGLGNLATGRMWIYAIGSSSDPLGGSSFAVLVLRSTCPPSASSLCEVPGALSGSVPLRGFVGYDPGNAGLRGAGFVGDPTMSFEVLSSQLSNRQLRAIGESVRVGLDGSVPTLEHVAVPTGYHQVVADASAGSLTAAGEAVDATAHGYVAVWTAAAPAEEGLRVVDIGVTASKAADLDALRWGLQAVTRVDINGRSAVLGSLPGGQSVSATSDGQGGTVTPGPRTWILSWFLPDGTTRVTIQALGGLSQSGCTGDCTPQVLERIARSLHPADAAQWRAFTAATTTTTLPSGCTTTPGGGQTCTISGTGTPVGVTTTVTGGR